MWLEDYRDRPRQVRFVLKRSPRALGVPYRGRMGKRDALACLAFRLTVNVRRQRPRQWTAGYRSRTRRGTQPRLRGRWRRQRRWDKPPTRSPVRPSPRPARLALSAAESATRAGSYRSRLLTPLAVHRLSFNRSGHSPFFRRCTVLLIKRQTTALVIVPGRFSHTRCARIHKPMRLAALILITCFASASEA